MDYKIVSNSPQQTIEIGQNIGSQLKGGEIIALCGRLGSGKTHLIKGIATGAGAADSRNINSPTFVIVNQYQGRLDIYHIDAYRLNSVSEFEQIGFDDYCYRRSVVVIEWADKIISALHAVDYIQIELLHITQTQRDIHISNVPGYIKVADKI